MGFYTRDRQLAYIDLEGELHFPVLFMYDEAGQSDFIEDVPEVHRARVQGIVMALNGQAGPPVHSTCGVRLARKSG